MVEADRGSIKKIVAAVVVFIALTVALTLGIEAIGVDRLRALVVDAGPLAPVIYVFVRALTYVIAPLSSGPLGFSAGILFGLVPGTVLTLLGEGIGGSINFWIARRFGRPIILRFVGSDGMSRVERWYVQAGNPWMLAYARLFLFSVYDFISYAAGLTSLRYRQYLIVTVVAGILPAALWVGIGASITGDFGQLLTMYGLLAIVAIVAFIVYGRLRHLVKVDTGDSATTTPMA